MPKSTYNHGNQQIQITVNILFEIRNEQNTNQVQGSQTDVNKNQFIPLRDENQERKNDENAHIGSNSTAFISS